MNLIRRLQRLWQLSSPETESISREEYDALLVFLKELDAEMKDMNGRVSDWIGVLIKSELLRRELERTKDDLTDEALEKVSGGYRKAGPVEREPY
jgi:hypothetical protein